MRFLLFGKTITIMAFIAGVIYGHYAPVMNAEVDETKTSAVSKTADVLLTGSS